MAKTTVRKSGASRPITDTPTFSDHTGPQQQLSLSEPSEDDLGTTLAKLGKTLAYSGILLHILAYSGTPTFSDHTGPQHWTFTF